MATPCSVLYKVSARGGVAEPLSTLNLSEGEMRHIDPFILPDGHGILFVSVSYNAASRIGTTGTYETC
jgi:hypothetical protein